MSRTPRIYMDRIPQTVGFTALPQARYLPDNIIEAVLDPIAEGPERWESATVLACTAFPGALNHFPIRGEQQHCVCDQEGYWLPVWQSEYKCPDTSPEEGE